MTRSRLTIRITAAAAFVALSLVTAPHVGAAATPERQARAEAPAAAKSPIAKAGTKNSGNSNSAQSAKSAKSAKAARSAKLDRSGKKQRGKASFYARKFAGRKMADGTPMNPRGNNAASKTLPLGTVARVTNLETGQSAAVTIRDRGPYVPGRIVDLSPATAEQIGIDRKEGLAPVEVVPIAVPASGSKPGTGGK